MRALIHDSAKLQKPLQTLIQLPPCRKNLQPLVAESEMRQICNSELGSICHEPCWQIGERSEGRLTAFASELSQEATLHPPEV